MFLSFWERTGRIPALLRKDAREAYISLQLVNFGSLTRLLSSGNSSLEISTACRRVLVPKREELVLAQDQLAQVISKGHV